MEGVGEATYLGDVSFLFGNDFLLARLILEVFRSLQATLALLCTQTARDALSSPLLRLSHADQMSWLVSKATCQLFVPAAFCLSGWRSFSPFPARDNPPTPPSLPCPP